MNLGELIDRHRALATEKAAAEKAVKAIEDAMKLVEQDITGLMATAGVDMAAGTLGKAVLREESMPRPADWEQIYEYIRDNNAFYLLHKRLSATVLREMEQAGQVVPGLEMVKTKVLHITKA